MVTLGSVRTKLTIPPNEVEENNSAMMVIPRTERSVHQHNQFCKAFQPWSPGGHKLRKKIKSQLVYQLFRQFMETLRTLQKNAKKQIGKAINTPMKEKSPHLEKKSRKTLIGSVAACMRTCHATRLKAPLFRHLAGKT